MLILQTSWRQSILEVIVQGGSRSSIKDQLIIEYKTKVLEEESKKPEITDQKFGPND